MKDRGGVSTREKGEYWGSRRLGEKINDKTEEVSLTGITVLCP